MADEDYGDDDAFYYDDDDYLYVEDDYAIADELAETQVPSPGYTGVYDEIAMEGFEYDVYEYFGELEYGSDSYWDARMKHLEAVGLGGKRKSAQEGEDTEARMVKKRRKEDARGDVQEVRDNVLYVPFERRLAPLPPGIEQQGGDGRFALLPDWKERFPERGSPVGKRRQMPAEMRKAAEEVVGDEEDEQEEADEDTSGDREDVDEMETGEDGESEEDDGNGDDEAESAAGLDQDLVMQVLRQKLADSGLGDVDESMFKDVIAKMMSGDGDSEDAVGGLASLLLGQEGGGGKAFEGFLAGQGVELGGAEGDDDEQESESKNGDDETDPRPTKKAKANPTRKTSQKPPSTASSSTAKPKPKPTTKIPSKSRTTRSNLSQTTTFQQSPSPNRTSPIVVPSPPPPATAVAAAPSTRPSRKRRAPSLDEPALPEPPQVAAETASSSAKPPAKRRRATPTSSRSETPADDSGTATTTRRRTTRSAATAGARKGGD